MTSVLVSYLRRPWGSVFKDTVAVAYRHDITDAAAAMAFDFVFATFPGILVLTALLGISEISPEEFKILLEDFGLIVPAPLLIVIEENIQHVWDSSQSLFFVGILGVIWPASASMSTTMSALNRAYSAEELRPFWQKRALSIVLLVSGGLSLVVLFNLIVFSAQVENWLHAHWDLTRSFPSLAGILRPTAGIGGTIAAAACIYRIGPNIKQRWSDVLPGSMLFVALWSAIAYGFAFFVQNFSYYNVVYGVLGAVIVLLLSAYLVSFVLLLGGELNGRLLLRDDRRSSG